MPLPTDDEISTGGGLDDQAARAHFRGKTMAQAEQLFRKAPLYYQEDLGYMGPVAFCFYAEALIRYIESPAADQDSDIVSCFASLLEWRLKREEGPEAVAGFAQRLASACSHILEQWERFEVDESIYGDLRGRYSSLRESFAQLSLNQ